MPKKPVELKEIRIACKTCKKVLVWPLAGWKFRVIGLIQFRCLGCGQIISFPIDEVWALKQGQDTENTAARLLFNFKGPDGGDESNDQEGKA